MAYLHCGAWVCLILPILVTLSEVLHSVDDIRRCDVNCVHGEVYVDCSSRNLPRVPRGIPENTTHLDLSLNRIQKLLPDSFPLLLNLNTLLVQDNHIHMVEKGALQNMPKLQSLNLDRNKINFSLTSLPVGCFQNLTELRFLNLSDMANGINNWVYPAKTMGALKKLENLHIDLPREPVFGQEFGQLKNLKKLIFGTCHTERLLNDTFRNFRNSPITSLSVGGCRNFEYVDSMTYSWFPSLKFLNAGDTAPFGLRPSLLSLKGLKGKNMTYVDFSYVRTYTSSVRDVAHNLSLVVTSYMTRHLTTLCLDGLNLRSNNIVIIQASAFLRPPFVSCLKYIDLSQNILIGEPELFFGLTEFINLEVLDFSNSDLKGVNPNLLLTENYETSGIGSNNNITWYLPQSLRKAILSNTGSSHTRKLFPVTYIVKGGEHLWYLDVSYAALVVSNCVFYGLENLTYLDLSGNNLNAFPSTFFRTLPNLSILHLRNVNFDLRFMSNSTSRSLFSFLKHVKKLDVSSNYIFLLHRDVFGDMNSLNYLDLSNNRFKDFPIRLTGLFELSYVNLSNNYISQLSFESSKMLDNYMEKNDSPAKKLMINLKGNVLACGCGSLDFAQWSIETLIQFDEIKKYTCMNVDGNVVDYSTFLGSYLMHWRSCSAKFWLAFAVCLHCVFISTVIVFILILRNSIFIKYRLLTVLGLNVPEQNRTDFRYDVFVYYSSTDDHRWVCNTFRNKMETERGLRLCIPDRDFQLGSCTAEEILDSIHSSWKTVVYVTETFLQDDLCSFTLSSAVHASTYHTPKRLILLCSEDIFQHPLPPVLTQLLDRDDVFMLDEFDKEDAWNRLYENVLRWM